MDSNPSNASDQKDPGDVDSCDEDVVPDPPTNNRPVYGAIGFVVGAWLLTWLLVYLNLDTWGARGQFGDMFGSINAIFSGLALGGVVYAIILQRDELKAQRDELRMTRSEMRQARKVYKAQERLMAEQKAVATHSSIATQVTELSRLRNELIVQYHHATNGNQRNAIRKRINSSAPILAHLLNLPAWASEERGGFARLAGIPADRFLSAREHVDEAWFQIPDNVEP